MWAGADGEWMAHTMAAGVWLVVLLLVLACNVARSHPGTCHRQVAAAAFAGVIRCGDRELAA